MSVSLFGQKCSRVKVKALLGLHVYLLSGEQIGKMRDPESRDHNSLPEFCVRDDTGKIDSSDYYFQFTDSGEEKFFLFNYIPMSDQLNAEIDNCGFDDIFRDINFAELMKYATIMKYDDYYRVIPKESIFVAEMEFWGQGEDYDVVFDIVGYLNREMEFVRIKKDEESIVEKRWPKPWKYIYDDYPKIMADDDTIVCTLPTGTLKGSYDVAEVNAVGQEMVERANIR